MSRTAKVLIAVIIIVLASGVAAYFWWKHPHQVAKRTVAASLLDPESARFNNLRTCYDGTRIDYVSGYVNSKNRMGGYVGDRFFVAYFTDSGPGAVEIEESDEDSSSVAAWVRMLQSRAATSQGLGGPAEPLHNCAAMDDFARTNAGNSTIEYSRMRFQNAIDAARGQGNR